MKGDRRNMKRIKSYQATILVFALLILVNIAGLYVNQRFDLTHDKRYTLSKTTTQLIENLEEPLQIKVYLQGEFPAEFKRLQTETNQFLSELNQINENVKFRFINPNSAAKDLLKKGLQASRLTVQEEGKMSEAVIFPWAIINYKNKEINVPLLVDALSSGQSQEQQLQASIENLEYEFAQAIYKISTEKSRSIAILKGNGQPADVKLYSFLKRLGDYYKLAEYTLDSVGNDPLKSLAELNQYDLSVIVKPTESFSEKEKLVLDQYIMQGGKTLWLLDNVYAEMDSLMQSGKTMAFNRDLNLTDMLFNYGIRINYNVTKDLYSGSIRLASGNTGNKVQYKDFLWQYYPLVFANNTHSISKNLDPVLLKFPSSLDTLKNNIRKTVLLSSSPLAKIVGTPANVSLNEIATEPNKNEYKDSHTPLAILLEGSFNSAYKNRILPFGIDGYKTQGVPNKMLVIGDGDIAVNETLRGEPLPLDKDKWTNQNFGNLDFLINSVHYLIDDSGILSLRSKSLQIQFLDKEKAHQEKSFWQLINLVLPLTLLFGFGWVFYLLRRRRYQ